jgi:trans-aconitate 2-methyltransferase
MNNMNKWNPSQYKKFEKERSQPFYDLMELVHPNPGMRIVDLGCGPGNLTQVLHKQLQASETLGIDTSEEMLAAAKPLQEPNLTFRKEDVAAFCPDKEYDLIFSNACLQWVPDHLQLITRYTSFLSEKGQIAIQMPMNFDYATHVIARELADESPFKKGPALKFNVLLPEVYADLLYRLGFTAQIVRVQVYAHELESTESIVEWVKGSLLTYYQSQYSEELYQQFLEEYKRRILECFGFSRPFLLPFKRILLWAQK